MTPRRTKQAISSQADKNPPHNVKFSVLDGDTESAVVDGQIGFIIPNNTNWGGGSLKTVVAIEIPFGAATMGANVSSPSTDLDAVDTKPLFDDAANKGGTILLAVNRTGYTDIAYVQAETISRESDHYALGNLVWVNPGSYTGTGHNWDIVAAVVTSGVLTKDIPDIENVLAKYVLRTDLEGHDTDSYASYDNAIFGGAYFPGEWCLFTGSTQPTDDTRAIAQANITTGSGVVVFGRLRSDKDPDKFVLGSALAAADFPSGRVIHAYAQGSKNPGHIKITLTSAGTLVGSGNSAHVWAQASWAEVGDVGPVANGNWWHISEFAPSDLDIRIPAADVLDPPWLEPTGTERTDGNIGTDTEVQLADGDKLELGELVEWHDEHHTGSFSITGLSYNTSSGASNMAANDVHYGSGIIYYKYPNAAARDSLKPKLVVGRDIVIAQTNPTATVTGKVSSTPADVFSVLAFNISDATVTGTLTNNADITIEVDSEIPSRSQFPKQVYVSSDDNVAGKGGTTGDYWARKSGDTDADWQTPRDTVRASGSTDTSLVSETGIRSAIPSITVSAKVSLSSSWKDIQTGLNNTDIVTICTEGAYSTESSNIAQTSITDKFADIPTSIRWLGIRANASGQRVEVRRNGAKIQARTQGNPANARAWVVVIQT